jgi:hypothetical protein
MQVRQLPLGIFESQNTDGYDQNDHEGQDMLCIGETLSSYAADPLELALTKLQPFQR